MLRNTGRAMAAAVLGLLLLGACSGGDDARSLGPVPTAPSTTVAPTTTVPATTSTTVRSSTTIASSTTTVPVVLVGGVPQVTATPARAAVGALVRIEGNGFTNEMWRAQGTNLWLAEKAGCNLYAQATHTVTISATGRLTGQFTVPPIGNCRMSDIGERPVTSGSYRIAFTCTACIIGELEVTTTAGPCNIVGFTPNSDDVASTIVATGVGCVEAEALVRKVGAQAGTLGPSRVDADGWVCRQVRQSDGPGLASADYECVNGTKKVTFHRT